MKLIRAARGAGGERSCATVAQVTFSEEGGFGAVGDSERRGMAVFGPRGIAYRPCEGDNLLLVEADGVDVCAGVLAGTGGMRGGELRLYSRGGASIYLKENGEVEINGVVITRSGEIRAPGEVAR